MKAKLNTIFFSCFFTAAFLAELYCLLVLKADLFTIGGLGIVILISLYLLLDSVRSVWKKGKEKTLLYLEQLYREETEKQDQRFTELLNLQKASYTSSKKNTARLEEKLEEVLLTLHSLEQSNAEALKRVAEYQKKLMEGQRNALNIEVNYNKDNTKAIIATIREEADRLNQEDWQEQLLEAMKGLQGVPSRVPVGEYISEMSEVGYLSETSEEEYRSEASEEEYRSEASEEEYLTEASVEEYRSEASEEEYRSEASEEEYLTEASEEEYQSETSEEEYLSETSEEEFSQEELPEERSSTDTIEDLDDAQTEENITEGVPESNIIPLYENPNTNLTSDEIASLFASYGK